MWRFCIQVMCVVILFVLWVNRQPWIITDCRYIGYQTSWVTDKRHKTSCFTFRQRSHLWNDPFSLRFYSSIYCFTFGSSWFTPHSVHLRQWRGEEGGQQMGSSIRSAQDNWNKAETNTWVHVAGRLLTMSTSEMLSKLSTWTSTPTGMAGPVQRHTARWTDEQQQTNHP